MKKLAFRDASFFKSQANQANILKPLFDKNVGPLGSTININLMFGIFKLSKIR